MNHTRFSLIATTFIIFVLIGLYYFLGGIRESKITESGIINYEMPRPKTEDRWNEYSLEGREIEREFKPFARATPSNHKTDVLKAPKKPLVAKNTEANEKDKNVKTENPEKDKKTTSEIADSNLKINSDDKQSPDSVTAAFGAPTKKSDQQNTQQNVSDQNNPNQIGLEEWRSLLMKDPSYLNLQKFSHAYRSREVTQTEYYQIVTELRSLKDPKAEIAALYLLDSAPSLKSFSELSSVTNASSVEAQNYANRILLGYNRAGYLSVLAQALQSQEIAIVLRAAQVINAGLARAKSGQPVDFTRNSRDPVVQSGPSLSSYQQFVPLFQNLQHTGNENLNTQVASFFSNYGQSSQ